ncbi:MAG: plasmid pRiA4b ORF-3 family protein [Bdellovibrionaceae bacterium]|nr:plasmid pRiA4b ORF-3 family protein [Pseudobdellovibrionaceae bacterium]
MYPRAVQLKIILENTKPEVWRRVLIMEGASLRTLHYLIQDVFWWKGYHSYMFKIGVDEFSDPEYDDGQGSLDDSKFKVGKIVEKFSEFNFIYDFGDWWSHKIIFEGFVEADLKEKYPVCTDGKNAAPPEDVGGPPGFEEFKMAIKDKKHKRHKEFFEWYDGGIFQKDFKLDLFDVELTNFKIGRREKPRLIKLMATKTPQKKKSSLYLVK